MGEGLLDLSQLPQIPELHTLVAGGGLSCITIPAKPRSPSLEGGPNSPSKTLALPRFQDFGDHTWSQQGIRRPASARTTKTRSGADMRTRPVSAKSRLQQSAPVPRNTAHHHSPARSPAASRSPVRAPPRTSSPRSPRTASPRISGDSRPGSGALPRVGSQGGALEVFSGHVAPDGQAAADAQPVEAPGRAVEGAAVPALDLERMRLSPGEKSSAARSTSAKPRGLRL